MGIWHLGEFVFDSYLTVLRFWQLSKWPRPHVHSFKRRAKFISCNCIFLCLSQRLQLHCQFVTRQIFGKCFGYISARTDKWVTTRHQKVTKTQLNLHLLWGDSPPNSVRKHSHDVQNKINWWLSFWDTCTAPFRGILMNISTTKHSLPATSLCWTSVGWLVFTVDIGCYTRHAIRRNSSK